MTAHSKGYSVTERMDGTRVDASAPAAPLPASDALAPGSHFGRYIILRRVGQGGMGTVYEAIHAVLARRVALKLLHRGVARQATARARFLREGRAASRVRHPHVVDVYDVGVHQGVPYLVMEFLDGEDLHTLLCREGPLPVARVADTLLPVVAAVAAAHDEGVIHRDLKPENIFLARERPGHVVPKILDFGVSKITDARRAASITGAAALLGTPNYMSPEQCRGSRDATVQSDQYALGAILYECATGHLPFESPTLLGLLQAIASDPMPSPRVHRPDLPQAFEALVLRAMARDPAERFPSVQALGRALLAFATPLTRAIWAPTFDPEGPAPDASLELLPTAPPPQPKTAPAPARDADGPSLAWSDTAVTTDLTLAAPAPPRASSDADPGAPAPPTETERRSLPPARPRRLAVVLAGVLAVGASLAMAVVRRPSHGEAPAAALAVAPLAVAHVAPADPPSVPARTASPSTPVLLPVTRVGYAAPAPTSAAPVRAEHVARRRGVRRAPRPVARTAVARAPAAPTVTATAPTAAVETPRPASARERYRLGNNGAVIIH